MIAPSSHPKQQQMEAIDGRRVLRLNLLCGGVAYGQAYHGVIPPLVLSWPSGLFGLGHMQATRQSLGPAGALALASAEERLRFPRRRPDQISVPNLSRYTETCDTSTSRKATKGYQATLSCQRKRAAIRGQRAQSDVTSSRQAGPARPDRQTPAWSPLPQHRTI